jgi:phosphoglycolate phosphatase
MQKACDACDVIPVTPLERHLIGPPLDAMLKVATNISDPNKLSQLRESFIEYYDSGECVLAEAFPGIEKMLAEVTNLGHVITLATNKRAVPTKKILESKNWQRYFQKVETIDSGLERHQSKTQMIRNILGKFSEMPSALFIGDTEWDFKAAQEAQIPCVIVDWGYNHPAFIDGLEIIKDPKDIFLFLNQK